MRHIRTFWFLLPTIFFFKIAVGFIFKGQYLCLFSNPFSFFYFEYYLWNLFNPGSCIFLLFWYEFVKSWYICMFYICSLCWMFQSMEELQLLNCSAPMWDLNNRAPWISIFNFMFCVICFSFLYTCSLAGWSTRFSFYCNWEIQILCSPMGSWDIWAHH